MSTLVTPEGETTCLEDFDLHTTNVSRMSHHECVANESPRVCHEWVIVLRMSPGRFWPAQDNCVTDESSRVCHEWAMDVKNESRKIWTYTRQLRHEWVNTSMCHERAMDVSNVSRGCVTNESCTSHESRMSDQKVKDVRNKSRLSKWFTSVSLMNQ